jgi:hypothetical protein
VPGTASPTQTLPPGLSIDACTLLSDAETEAATGEGVLDRTPSTLTQVFRSVCDIELDGGGSLTVSVLGSGGRSLYATSFEPFIGEESGTLEDAVTGLGDKAGRSDDDELMVLSGDVLFDVLYVEFGRQDKLAVVRYLAEIILAKLPCLAVGCPGFNPPPPPSAAAAIDACALLTQAQVETSTRFQILETKPEALPGRDPKCTWTLDTQPFPGTDYIELALMSTGGRAQFEFLAGAYDPPLEHVPGVADDAIKTATIPDGAVYALAGDRLLTLQFSLPLSVDDPYSLVMPLVNTAVSRL